MKSTAANFPVGNENFYQLATSDYTFVDKTLLIKEVLTASGQILLFTRPRRWGKTLNMSMLHHFFAPEVYGNSTKGLFDKTLIAQPQHATYYQEQGQHPVIFISFGSLKERSYKRFLNAFKYRVTDIFRPYERLLMNSKQISELAKERLVNFIRGTDDEEELKAALYFLTELISTHYQKPVVLLIDEYDQPLNHAYAQGYWNEITSFMRGVFSYALKTNPYISRGVLTGVLRIAKSGMFSGLNNVAEYDLFENKYAEHFGFTELEVKALIEESSAPVSFDDIKRWYNGYQIGEHLIFNPWSIMSCLSRDGKFDVYWINTSDNQLLKDRLRAALPEISQNFLRLLQGQSISITVDRYVSIDDTQAGDPSALWTLLLHAGYLTLTKIDQLECGSADCDVRVPNFEVQLLYTNVIKRWYQEHIESPDVYTHFVKSLIAGDIHSFKEQLTTFLSQSLSYYDISGSSNEQAYHMFMMGLVAGLHRHYVIKSNRESGAGRFDLVLMPKDPSAIGIVFEFKHQSQDVKDKALVRAANEALKQIDSHQYALELTTHGVKRQLYIGIAFAGKRVEIAHTANSPLLIEQV